MTHRWLASLSVLACAWLISFRDSRGFRRFRGLTCKPKSVRWGTCSRAFSFSYLRTGGTVTPVIQQTVVFRTTPRTLFAMYLDSKKHSKSTGMSALISGKVGRRFRAFKVILEGKNLLIVFCTQMVQLCGVRH